MEPTAPAPAATPDPAPAPARIPAPPAAAHAESGPLVELPLPKLQGHAGPAINEAEVAAGADISLRWRAWLTSRGSGPIVKVLIATRATPTPRTRIAIVNDIAANETRHLDVPSGMFTLPFAVHDAAARLRATAEYGDGSRLIVELTPLDDPAARPTILTLSYRVGTQIALEVVTQDGRTLAVAPDPGR